MSFIPKCKKCGTQVPAEAGFCPECGTRLVLTHPPVKLAPTKKGVSRHKKTTDLLATRVVMAVSAIIVILVISVSDIQYSAIGITGTKPLTDFRSSYIVISGAIVALVGAMITSGAVMARIGEAASHVGTSAIGSLICFSGVFMLSSEIRTFFISKSYAGPTWGLLVLLGMALIMGASFCMAALVWMHGFKQLAIIISVGLLGFIVPFLLLCSDPLLAFFISAFISAWCTLVTYWTAKGILRLFR